MGPLSAPCRVRGRVAWRAAWWALAGLGAASVLAAGCGGNGGASADSADDAAPEVGPFQVYAEGLCPKLKMYDVGKKSFLVYGTYGLDAVPFGDENALGAKVTAAQSFAEALPTGPKRRAELLAGLPMTKDGWIRGDVEIGGRFPSPMWIARVETSRGAGSQGVLYERNRLFYAYQGKTWQLEPNAKDAATPGMRAPDLPEAEICERFGEGISFATYAAARLPSGDSLVAGRCEDARHRAQGGVHLASFVAGETSWKIADAPPADLFQSIVNLGLAFVERGSAYLHAYPPYDDGEVPAYVVKLDGRSWSEVELPFAGPVVSMATTESGELWVIRGWSELWRYRKGQWTRVGLPDPVFVEPLPERLRLLEVQVLDGAVWVHAAYPVWLEGAKRTAARGHVLFTSREVDQTTYCDRRRKARKALSQSDEVPRLEGAVERR